MIQKVFHNLKKKSLIYFIHFLVCDGLVRWASLFPGQESMRQQILKVNLQTKLDAIGVTNINGALFYLVCELTYSTLFGILNFLPSDFPLVAREYHDGLYSVLRQYKIRNFPNQTITLQLLRGSMPVLSPTLYHRRSSNAANFLLASRISIGLGSGSLILLVVHTIRLSLGSAGLSDQFSHRAIVFRFRNHAFLRITFLPHSDEFCRPTSDPTFTHWRSLCQRRGPAFVHLMDPIPILVQVVEKR